MWLQYKGSGTFSWHRDINTLIWLYPHWTEDFNILDYIKRCKWNCKRRELSGESFHRKLDMHTRLYTYEFDSKPYFIVYLMRRVRKRILALGLFPTRSVIIDNSFNLTMPGFPYLPWEYDASWFLFYYLLLMWIPTNGSKYVLQITFVIKCY